MCLSEDLEGLVLIKEEILCWLKEQVIKDNLSSRPLSLVFSPLQQSIVSPGDEAGEKEPASQPQIFLPAVPAGGQEEPACPHHQQRQSQRV